MSSAQTAVANAELLRREAIAAAYHYGITARQIADYSGLSVQRVQAIIQPYRNGSLPWPPALTAEV